MKYYSRNQKNTVVTLDGLLGIPSIVEENLKRNSSSIGISQQ
jgi:hypothetical protein